MNKHLLRRTGCTIAALAMTISMGACGAKIQGDSSGTGPIKIWLSNNEQEVTWDKDMVKAWNEKHPDQKITAQEIPASSSSEEAITAAITAGTAPCLVYNISAAAVPGWVRQGGLVDLGQFDGTNQYITERSGDGVNIYQTDGKYYQMPWKSNPVMVMYNKDIFSKAGIDADNPNIGTFTVFSMQRARSSVPVPRKPPFGRLRPTSSTSRGSIFTRHTWLKLMELRSLKMVKRRLMMKPAKRSPHSGRRFMMRNLLLRRNPLTMR